MPESFKPEINADRLAQASLLPSGLRWAGPLLAPVYELGLRLHRALITPQKAPITTICVGNLTVGGTGKTPAVKYLARGLAAKGHKPAVLMRGYKGQSQDEAQEVTQALAELHIPVLLGADRLAGARSAQAQGCDVALLDDGFQHWRLARDLDIVLVDATNPFGGGHLVPWGRLRERPEALARAGAVVITRAYAVPAGELAKVEAQVRQLAPRAVLAKARHKPVQLRECLSGKVIELEKLKGCRVAGVCGVGNPYAFWRTLTDLGAEIMDFTTYPDHCEYDAAELDSVLIPRAQAKSAAAIVVTEKDASKLRPLLAGVRFPVWSLEVRFEVFAGEEALWQIIQNAKCKMQK